MDSDRHRIKREKRLRRIQAVALVFGIAVLTMIGLRLAGVIDLPFQNESSPTVEAPSPIPSREPTLVPATNIPPTSEATIGATLTSQGPGTPADAWASAVLDRALPVLTDNLPPADGLAWWQNSDLQGALAITGNMVLVGDAIADARNLLALTVSIPDPGAPNRLMDVGRIDWQGGALHLTVTADLPDEPEPQWLLSGVDFPVAITALVVEADKREVHLQAAFSEQPGREAQIVLVGVESMFASPTLTLTATSANETPRPTLTPTLTRTPTPTREPEPYMGRVLAALLDPILETLPDLTNGDVSTLMTVHPWAGTLTWTESGPLIAGRSIPLAAADTLYLYAADLDLTNTERWLVATTDGNTTHLPEEQIIFQGRRLDEILYWLVRRAGETDGQLVVTFDDFGTRQAITVVGFKPFSESP